MKRFIYSIIMTIMVLPQLYAINGANISYEYINGNAYEVTLRVYYNCGAIVNNTSDTTATIVVREKNFYQGGLNLAFTPRSVTLTRDTSHIILGNRGWIWSSNPPLTNCNGGTASGARMISFKGVVSLPYASRFVLSFTSSDNRDSTTNLVNGNIAPIYIEAGIDNRRGGYDTPWMHVHQQAIYSTFDSIPQESYFYYGGYVRGDDRVHTFIAPYSKIRYQSIAARDGFAATGTTNQLSYQNGTSALQPIAGTQFDLKPKLGQIRFTPSLATPQSATVATRMWMVSYWGDTLGFVDDDRVFSIVRDTAISNNIKIGKLNPLVNCRYDSASQTIIPLSDNSVLFSQTVVGSPGDTIRLNQFQTNINQVFGSGNVSIFQQTYRLDSIEFYVIIDLLVEPAFVAGSEYRELIFSLGVTGDWRVAYNHQIPVYRIGQIEGIRAGASPAIVCNRANRQIHLQSNLYYEDTTMVNGQYHWRQIAGNPTLIADTTAANTTVLLPPFTSSQDSFLFEVQYISTPTSGGVIDTSIQFVRVEYDQSRRCLYPLSAQLHAVIDSNFNCQRDSTDVDFLDQLSVKIEDANQTMWSGADSGLVDVHLDTGTYVLTTSYNRPYWYICNDTQQLQIDTNYQQPPPRVDFLLQPLVACPQLQTLIQYPRLRRCFSNAISIRIKNIGTVSAPNAYVDVVLDTSLIYMSANATLLSQQGNRYRFGLDTMEVNEQRHLQLIVTVSCSSSLGQIHCIETQVYPDSICLPDIPNIRLDDRCQQDTVYFDITNLSRPYDTLVPYQIQANGIIVDTGSLSLSIGNTYTLAHYNPSHANCQLILVPTNTSLVTASSVNNCTPVLTQLGTYQPYRNIGYRSESCVPNIGSYDPNDKVGIPRGGARMGYTPPNVPLDYRIRFQNTGTDTAIFIRILDTIDTHLDIATLQMGASSHSYEWKATLDHLLGQYVLQIIYDRIYLPDSMTNPVTSNGFVTYTIEQQPNLPNGTLLTNSAAIYFDYNAPILTNTTRHKICENCLPPINIGGGVVTTIEEVSGKMDNYTIYPNPTNDYVYIHQQVYQLNSQWAIYTLQGQLLDSGSITSDLERVRLVDYSAGLYLLTIQDAKQKRVFKLVVGE